MDSSPIGSFILIFTLILVNSFFASAEMAVVSLNKSKINMLADKGDKKAILLLNLIKEPSGFLATIQVAITLSGFFASASAATSISSKLQVVLDSFSIPYSQEISLVLITVFISYLTLVLGELLPKRIALQNAEKVAMFVVKPVIFISKITKPFVWFLSNSTNIILKLFRVETEGIEEKVSREEIKSLLETGEAHGAINETEKEMIDGIIEFDDTLAKEIMTPRTECFTLDINEDINYIIQSVIEENYSRIPIYNGDIDNIIGILYMKDLFRDAIKKGVDNIDLNELLHEPCLIPETNNIDDVFKILKSTQNYMAILIDEYGGFSGIATIEDLVEEVMGEIDDEYDETSFILEKIDKNKYVVNALITIDDLNEKLDTSLSSESSDTIGGLVLETFGRIPKKDEEICLLNDNIIFKVLELDDNRIDKVLIIVNNKEI